MRHHVRRFVDSRLGNMVLGGPITRQERSCSYEVLHRSIRLEAVCDTLNRVEETLAMSAFWPGSHQRCYDVHMPVENDALYLSYVHRRGLVSPQRACRDAEPVMTSMEKTRGHASFTHLKLPALEG